MRSKIQLSLPKSPIGPPLTRLNPLDLPPDIDTFAQPNEGSRPVEQDPTGRYLRVDCYYPDTYLKSASYNN